MAKKNKTSVPAESLETSKDPILINAQFIRDLSFEAPTMPEILSIMVENPPQINVNVNVSTKKFDNSVFEVGLEIDAKANVNDKTGFILELEYCGIFTLNCDPDVEKALVLIECPRLLFPFARSILAQTTRDAGFPPLMLGNVDFARMYREGVETNNTENNK